MLDRKVTDDLVGPGLTHEVRAWLTELSPDRWRTSSLAASPTKTWSARWTQFPARVQRGLTRGVRHPAAAQHAVHARQHRLDLRGVTLNPMYWPARRQETLLTTAVYRFHPAFADEKYEVWLGDADGRPADHGLGTLEGGDVMPIGKGSS